MSGRDQGTRVTFRLVADDTTPAFASTDPSATSGEAPRRRLGMSALIFGLATGLSRVLGLVREMVAGYYFGAAGRINAFTVAFQIPNLVRALVADAALSSAFVPVSASCSRRASGNARGGSPRRSSG